MLVVGQSISTNTSKDKPTEKHLFAMDASKVSERSDCGLRVTPLLQHFDRLKNKWLLQPVKSNLWNHLCQQGCLWHQSFLNWLFNNYQHFPAVIILQILKYLDQLKQTTISICEWLIHGETVNTHTDVPFSLCFVNRSGRSPSSSPVTSTALISRRPPPTTSLPRLWWWPSRSVWRAKSWGANPHRHWDAPARPPRCCDGAKISRPDLSEKYSPHCAAFHLYYLQLH